MLPPRSCSHRSRMPSSASTIASTWSAHSAARAPGTGPAGAAQIIIRRIRAANISVIEQLDDSPVTGGYADWCGHVIVCGLHSVGLRIVEQLNLSGVPAVVIDDDPDMRLVRELTGWGVPHLAGSPRSAATLTAAGLPGAAALICVLEDDLHTLETVLLTRELRADVRVVVQLANPAVGRALAEVDVSVLDVAGLSAPAIAEACLQSGTQEIALDGERFLAAQTTAPRTATLRDLYGALAPGAVLPAAGGDVVVGPGRDHTVARGDRVTLFATPEELRAAGISAQV